MHKQDLFEKEYVDENDSLKVIGITKDNKIYVTEKTFEEMTDDELNEYIKRRPVPNIEDMFITVEQAYEDIKNAKFVM
jgi:hypothetical protein